MRDSVRFRLPYRLSGALGILALISSAAGLFVPGLYRDAPDWIAQTRGTDLVTLVIGVPALVVSLILSAGGSQRARVVWLGTLGYFLYIYVIYAFDIAFNPLFLVYVAIVSLSLWSLIALLVRMNVEEFRSRFSRNLPTRPIASYLLVVSALFVLAWMSQIIPSTLGNTTPTVLQETRLPTNPVHVLDLSVLLPVAALSGIWLWQHRSWGYVLAGVVLTTMTIVGASIVSDSVFEYVTIPKKSLAIVPLFVVITLIGLWLLAAYLRSLREGPKSVPGRFRADVKGE